eukprot:CAMPEP_0176107476 /NCGR_PEP_ID=MMETSP0120_2-20121206/53941_1 /TAXON_ID=160619 /ORGANISM="Kryptoperidinium foliaceum, Strain CCMP 1326" /LENGTH=49 /DNA_ID= /DNA_START= /DNA_END= /DNA_ORIENTATION=
MVSTCLLPAIVQATPVEPAVSDEALLRDDECIAGGEQCALNALQLLRGT